MDQAAVDWHDALEDDPWLIVSTGAPLPAQLDLEKLRAARIAVYAIIQALDATLDETLPLIGLLAEIDGRLEAAARAGG